PGHSPHHFAIATASCLFAGEAGGVCLPLPSGDVYLRPATPPRFFLETSLSSIDRLMALNPRAICYGHFGRQEGGAAMLAGHRDQLLFWRAVLAGEGAGAADPSSGELNAWVDRLLAEDPRLAGFSQLPPDIRERERGFLLNSVNGFAGYLADLQASRTGDAGRS
ncbi:MAG TPA: hypothetical protein VLT88_13330, partial [Desulfosarcina sp.]|nr:hypothetical protein [Desulfosarcina sp.]